MAEDRVEPKVVSEATSQSAPREPTEGDVKPTNDGDGPADEAKIGNFWRILSYGTSLDWLLMGAASLCSVGAGVALPLMNIVFGKLVGDFNAFFIPGTGVTRDQFLRAVNKNALYIVYLFIGKFVLAYVSIFCFRITGIRISAALRLAYLRALFAQDISVFDKLPPGKATSMITSSANTIQIGISEKLSILLQSLALVIGAYVIAFRYSWALTLVSSSTILFIILVYGFTVPLHIKALRLVEKANESASAVAGESFSSIRTIVACGAEERVGSRYAEWIKQARRRGLKMSGLTGVQLAPAFFAIYCNFALTFWFGVRLYRENHIASVGTVVTVFFSVILVVTAIGSIAAPLTDISKSASASTGFFLTIDVPSPQTTGLKEPEVSAHEDIIFDDVTFAYPSRPDVKVLEKLSARFPAGQLTAIVGPSGSGKSTVVALLERWYQFNHETNDYADSKLAEDEKQSSVGDGKPTLVVPIVNLGSITVGDHQLQTLDLKWWRSQIGLVQQEPFTFNATIYKNVAYGLVGSKWEHCGEDTKLELVKEACREAFADEFINRLPLGYETMVGENGIQLSGGQRQRLAIARSIIKRPPILILDEATSAIDVRGEGIVQKALDRVSKDRTTISIAHRLSTVKRADNIIVLKDGAVAEQGTHQSLLKDEAGVYYNLVHAQHLEMSETRSEYSPEDDALELEQTSTAKDDRGKISVVSDVVSKGEEEAYKPRSLLRTVGFFLYEQRPYWKLYGFLLVAAMGCGAAYALQSYIFAQLIAVFQLTGPKLTERGNFWSLMFFIEAICVGTFYFILGWTANSISIYISTIYRQQYFESIISKPISFYDAEENSAGSLTSRLSTDPTQLQELLGANMAFPLIAVFNVTGCIAISFAFGWKLTVVTMFSALPVIVLAGFMRVRFEIQFEKLNAAVFAESSQFASEAIGAFRTVTSLTLEDTIIDRYTVLLRDHVRKAFLKARFATLIFAASDSLELLCMALCFWYGGRLLSTREYNVVQFFVIYVAIVQGGQAAGQWSSFAPNIAQATAAANRILSLRSKSNPSTSTASTILDDNVGGAKIQFKNVHFKYPGRDVPVFAGLNLSIEKGQFAALVGPSGCGKTSVISLLERFYDAQSGSITYDGADISTLDITAYRKKLSLVSQEPTLYQGSIRDNVLLGVEANSVTDAEIHQACKDAEIHDFIISLPEGYSTPVGLKGVALSGGQKQRLAIARALLRNPRLLLLDEATSSLDSQSERLVQASFERAAKGRTMIVVAHRLATVQNAQVIFVFGNAAGAGTVVEAGSHRGLLARKGVYWQMCQSQALDR